MMKYALYCGNKSVNASQVLDGEYPMSGPYYCPVCKLRVVYRYFSNQKYPIFAHSPPNVYCSLARGGRLEFDR